jgi:hypothetical protein
MVTIKTISTNGQTNSTTRRYIYFSLIVSIIAVLAYWRINAGSSSSVKLAASTIETEVDNFALKIDVMQQDMLELKRISQELIVKLNKEKKFNEETMAAFRKYPPIDSEIIKFNVGGTRFSTFKSTLLKKRKRKDATADEQYYKPTLFEGMLNGNVQVKYDEEKAIFIDRNPRYFQVILDYLRTVNTPDESNKFELPPDADLKEFKKDTIFYHLFL